MDRASAPSWHVVSHLSLSLEVDPALRVKSFFADGFVELLVLLVRDVFLLTGPDGHIVVHTVPAPSVHLQIGCDDSAGEV